MPINKPGARSQPDGTIIIQLATRGDQLESIADAIDSAFLVPEQPVPVRTALTLKGYAEQLRIIAEELKDQERPWAERNQRQATIPLTREDERQILKDFMAWSGGFTPEECQAVQIASYIGSALDMKFDQSAAFYFLMVYRKTDGDSVCQRCNCRVVEGRCVDETCPFSECQQTDPAGWVGHPDVEAMIDKQRKP